MFKIKIILHYIIFYLKKYEISLTFNNIHDSFF